jgi:hypothetical protein
MITKNIGIGLSILSLLFLTNGCGFKDYNKAISTQNTQRFTAFTKGMNSANSEGARVAIAMGFASNMGVAPLARPETAKDYIRTIAPFITPFYTLFHKKEETSMKAGRDMYINSTRSDTTTSSAITDTLGSGHEIGVGFTPDYSTESTVTSLSKNTDSVGDDE